MAKETINIKISFGEIYNEFMDIQREMVKDVPITVEYNLIEEES